MKLSNVKAKIDSYFDNISPEEFYKTLIKYHMRTVFKGTINGKDFDNVQDYNAEMQRLIASGEPINAHANTQTVESNSSDNSFLFPGFAHCTGINSLNDDFISAALEFDPDKFAADVNNLLHERILPAIEKMPTEALGRYKELVTGILGYLNELASASEKTAMDTVARLEEIEKELATLNKFATKEQDRKAVIDFVASLYESINGAISARGNVAVVPQPCNGHQDPAGPRGEAGVPCPGKEYLEDIKTKARALFGL